MIQARTVIPLQRGPEADSAAGDESEDEERGEVGFCIKAMTVPQGTFRK